MDKPDTQSQKKTTFVQRADSRAQLTTFSPNKNWATLYPNFTPQAVIELVDKDPVARGALSHFIDKCMEGDFVILDKATGKIDKEAKRDLMEKYDFRSTVLRGAFTMGKMYNNVFLEVIGKSDGKAKEVNLLDTSIMDPITKPNGDLLKLKSRVINIETGAFPLWQESEVCWIKFNDRVQGFAPIDWKALWESLLLKDYLRQYLAWLHRTGQYRVIYAFDTTAADQDIENFLTYIRKHDNNFQVPFLLKGKLDLKQLRDLKETDYYIALLKYLDNQVLIAMRIPPNDAGIPDASGRSNADAQTNNLDTHIQSWKSVIQDAINHDLLPKMGYDNLLLQFGPTDRFSEEQVFATAQTMKALGLKNEIIQQYITSKGIYFEGDEWFEPQPVMGAPANPREKDTAPSRQPKMPGTGNEQHDAPTSRPDQIHPNR